MNELLAEEAGNSEAERLTMTVELTGGLTEVDSACRDPERHSDTTEPISVPINVQGHLELDNFEFIKESVIPNQGESDYLNHPIFCIDRLFGSTACLALRLRQACRIQQCEHSTLHGLEVENIDDAFPDEFCVCLSKVRTGWMSSLEKISPELGHDFLLIDKCSRACHHTVVELSEPRMVKCMIAHHFQASIHQLKNNSLVVSKENQGWDTCHQYFQENEEAMPDTASAKLSTGYPLGKDPVFKNQIFGSRSSSSVPSSSLSLRTKDSTARGAWGTQSEHSDVSQRSPSEYSTSSLQGDELPLGLVNFKLSETKGFITRNDEIVETLRRELSTIHHLTIPTKDQDTQHGLWAEGTWFDSVTHHNATIVVFQRPDDWIQIIGFSREEPDQGYLFPFTKAIPNTPLRVESTNEEHSELRIFFFRHEQNGPALAIGMLHFDQTNKNLLTWDLKDLCNPCTLPHPIPGINFFKLAPGVLGYACLDGLLIVGESDNGIWSRVKYNRNIGVNRGNQIISSASPISLLRIDQNVYELFEFIGVDSWSDIHVKDDMFNDVKFSTKKLNWEGLEIDKSSQILAIGGKTNPHAGIFCKDANNDVYLLRGRPWENEFGSPEKICTTKVGTTISLGSDSTLLFFISTENEVKKLDLDLTELDTIKITGPHPVLIFSPSWTEIIETTVAAGQAMDPYQMSRSVSSYSGSSSSSRS
jgi:hypothetical protein